MLYVLSPHVKRAWWLTLQERYFKRYFDCEYHSIVSIDRFIGKQRRGRIEGFDEVYDRTGRRRDHKKNLNFLLGKLLRRSKSDDDLGLFLDSDCFPVQPLDEEYFKGRLDRGYYLVANRLNGETRAHCSFCCTTVGRWREMAEANGGSAFEVDYYERKGSMEKYGKEVKFRDPCILMPEGVKWWALNQTSRLSTHHEHFAVHGWINYHHFGGSRTRIGTAEEILWRDIRSRIRKRREITRLSNSILEKLLSIEDFWDQRFFPAVAEL